MSRPDMLLAIMGGDMYALNRSVMTKALRDTNELCYSVYTVLMDADVDPKDVVSMHNDGESIAIKFKSKAIAKEVRGLCNKEVVRYGNHRYKVKMKLRDQYLTATCEKIADDIEES